MQIGVFSKFEMIGGSENRCVEMVNAVAKFTSHQATLLCENDIPPALEAKVHSGVRMQKKIFSNPECATHCLDAEDCLLVVNTDSKWFCRLDYWQGLSGRHTGRLDLTRIGQVVFLFNFIVSPSQHLWELAEHGVRLKIVTANRKFLDEIGDQDRYQRIRHLPRMRLESPIDPSPYVAAKKKSPLVRIGMHSTSNSDKWNQQWPELIRAVNASCGPERITWRFMGMPGAMRAEVHKLPNVQAVPEHTVPVADFLSELDVFAFFASWRREEPWSRSVAEALTSGCPIVCTPRGGNRDQIVNGNNGMLCKTLEEFIKALVLLVDNLGVRKSMSRLAKLRAQEFSTERVIHRFLRFLEE